MSFNVFFYFKINFLFAQYAKIVLFALYFKILLEENKSIHLSLMIFSVAEFEMPHIKTSKSK